MDGDQWRAVILGSLGLLLIYGLVCWIWPWATCSGELFGLRRCDGGRYYQPGSRKAWRDCRKCGGTNKRRRLGRSLWAWFIVSKRKAAKK